ncbi:hypothetical protein ACWEN4_03835 [Streptomyces violaceorubidus]
MELISVAEAARRLSVSDVAAYAMVRAGRLTNRAPGGPAQLSADEVTRLAHRRRAEALRRTDVSALAAQVDSLLHPDEANNRAGQRYLMPKGAEALKLLPTDAFAVFGRDVLTAAAARSRLRAERACPTCFAHASARVHITPEPRDEPAYRVLLGEPCAADRQRWSAEADARRAEAARLREQEAAARHEAAKVRAAADFRAAQAQAETAASRLRSAARAYAAADPTVALQASAQGRGRAGCGCTRDRYCAEHTAMFGTSDRSQARR